MNKTQTHPKTETPAKPAAGKQPEEGESCLTRTAVEDMLDEELEQSFPASDPPSMTRVPPDVCEKKSGKS